jgi:hypothetical protein
MERARLTFGGSRACKCCMELESLDRIYPAQNAALEGVVK